MGVARIGLVGLLHTAEHKVQLQDVVFRLLRRDNLRHNDLVQLRLVRERPRRYPVLVHGELAVVLLHHLPTGRHMLMGADVAVAAVLALGAGVASLWSP